MTRLTTFTCDGCGATGSTAKGNLPKDWRAINITVNVVEMEYPQPPSQPFGAVQPSVALTPHDLCIDCYARAVAFCTPKNWPKPVVDTYPRDDTYPRELPPEDDEPTYYLKMIPSVRFTRSKFGRPKPDDYVLVHDANCEVRRGRGRDFNYDIVRGWSLTDPFHDDLPSKGAQDNYGSPRTGRGKPPSFA